MRPMLTCYQLGGAGTSMGNARPFVHYGCMPKNGRNYLGDEVDYERYRVVVPPEDLDGKHCVLCQLPMIAAEAHP